MNSSAQLFSKLLYACIKTTLQSIINITHLLQRFRCCETILGYTTVNCQYMMEWLENLLFITENQLKIA